MMLICADARALPLADVSIDCCVTSPPYWGLRDYGTPQQIGLEATPDQYVATLRDVFREVWRVLKPTGTVWLNLGDSYAGGGRAGSDKALNGKQVTNRGLLTMIGRPFLPPDLASKQLVGIPWRVAFALQADGWYLRSDIIWSKPNPMPESVTDRPTRSHEYLFLLAKSARYFFDADAIAELTSRTTSGNRVRKFGDARGRPGSHLGASIPWTGRQRVPLKKGVNGDRNDGGASDIARRGYGRNRRSVWTITAQPYAGAHFATMPEKLIEPCILAGCPLGGIVFDPFVGSGTVGAVADRHHRRWIGVDLTYQDLARQRTAIQRLPFFEAVLG